MKKLISINKPSVKESQELRNIIFRRLIKSEAQLQSPKMQATLYEILVYMVTKSYNNNITPELENQLLNFVLLNPRKRGNILIIWLQELYKQSKGTCFGIKDSENAVIFTPAENMARYNAIMAKCLRELIAKNLMNELIFGRVFLEAPIITEEAMEILRQACLDTSAICICIFRKHILCKKDHSQKFYKLLVEFSKNENENIRKQAVAIINELASMCPEIQEYMVIKSLQ